MGSWVVINAAWYELVEVRLPKDAASIMCFDKLSTNGSGSLALFSL